MNKFTVIAVVSTAALITGCVDLKPLQAQVNALDGQVGKLQASNNALADRVTAVEGNAKAANDSAKAANAAAANAQNTANQAVAAAAAAQAGVDANSEKIDRAFKKSVQK